MKYKKEKPKDSGRIIQILSRDEIRELIESAVYESLGQRQLEEENEELLSIDQVADFFHVSRATIFNWKRSGILPFQKIGGRVYVLKKDCIASLKNWKGGGAC